jgi:hypothetical protein
VSLSDPLLLAIPDAWSADLARCFEAYRVPTQIVRTFEKALAHVRSQHLCGLILVSEWAVDVATQKPTALFTAAAQVPVVTLIRLHMLRIVFDSIYNPPQQQFCMIPVDCEELAVKLRRAGVAFSLP